MKLRRTQELKCRSLMKSIALAYAGHGIASGCRRRRRSHPAHLGKCVLACLDGALITSHWRDRWWSDDRDGPEDRWEPSIQLDQEQAIPICELDATAHPPPQHNQLMSECRVLCLKSAL